MYKERLIAAINRYRQGSLKEIDFQKTIESIASSITEDHLNQVRDFLMNVEGELEYINYMVNINLRHDKYLEQIIRIENFITAFD